jgi:serine/threonine protein kinase
MSSTVDAQPGTFGRFKLSRVLGRGAQATVWLGFDARLEREVAIKLLNASQGSDDNAMDQWLQEARSVSRLAHPHIVPLFEADQYRQQPYLVYELVTGGTVAEALRQRGAMPVRNAVELMLGVLDALVAAHAAGVVHRDLKPSNILLDAAGRARVMDFGIAARLQDAATSAAVVGTPCYMSPEAAAGLAPYVGMDVFAAGLVFVELLSGKRLIDERDPYKALYRVIHEDMALPAGLPAEVDDRLRAILLRALARDRRQRHDSASAFRQALLTWTHPAADVGVASRTRGAAGAGAATLDFLLRRMRNKTDFPALSGSVIRIQRVANSESASLGTLSNEILRDVALTQKLLRLVNTAHYGHAGGGSISTVSRAVALVGFAGIRNLALSLVFLEHMQDKGHASELQEEFLRALLAGSVAGELCSSSRDTEEAFIGAMFQNLGRMLTQFYLADESAQIRALVQAARSGNPSVAAMTETDASLQVLGLSFEELGLGVAKSWGLPSSLQRCMRKVVGDPPKRPPDQATERIRLQASLSNEMADTLLAYPAEEAEVKLRDIAERYTRALEIKPQDMLDALGRARLKLAQFNQVMKVPASTGSRAGQLLAVPDAATVPDGDAMLLAHELQATLTMTERLAPALRAADVMAAGIQDITNSMVENFKLNEVLHMVLETMLKAVAFRRVVFCLRDQKSDTLTGRFGLGEDAAKVAAGFKVALKGSNDLFAAVCIKGADTLISDATVSNLSASLPAWYRQAVNAPAFLLLPLQLKGAPFGLIYADKAQPGGIELDEKELSMLRTLRNQAVMAFKQAG